MKHLLLLSLILTLAKLTQTNSDFLVLTEESPSTTSSTTSTTASKSEGATPDNSKDSKMTIILIVLGIIVVLIVGLVIVSKFCRRRGSGKEYEPFLNRQERAVR